MKKPISLLLPILAILAILLIAGCSQEQGGGGQVDYEQTKKMVVDILKTDDGKKAIQDVMSDDKFRQQLILDQQVVTDTIQTTLTSDKGMEFWKKAFQDPKFAETVAKSMQKEHEQLIKNLMNDPEYRGKLVEVLQDPQMEKEITNVLKSNAYREHLKQVVTGTMESPLYQTKVQELLLKASESKPKEEKKSGEKA